MVTFLLKNIGELVDINSDNLIVVFQLPHELEHILDADEPIVVGIQQMETESYLVDSAPFEHGIDDSEIF